MTRFNIFVNEKYIIILMYIKSFFLLKKIFQGCILFSSLGAAMVHALENFMFSYFIVLLFRVVEAHRTCETTATLVMRFCYV